MVKRYELIIDSQIIPCKLKKHGRAKRLIITVDINGVSVVIPSFIREIEARRLLEEKKNWIITKIKELQVHQEEQLAQRELRKQQASWYRQQANEAIMLRVRYYSEKVGVAYNTVRIKDQKTRWGSCSAKKNLNFNWRLIMAPPEVLDYVVVHELCHLIHLNHSPAFWQLVKNQLPDYSRHKRWLKDQGATLMAF
ncbi:MAG: M48 family metallopeptidase [Clostridia bacterium]|jgi:predicted metal-dependent hydrolase|nr:M48 family metallopeptidase [Clostridia bacterium]